jgi:hypothetical protein
MSKIQVSLEEVKRHQDFRTWLNSLDLEEVEILDNGVSIQVSKEELDGFKYTGLSNMSFFELEWWNGPTEIWRRDDS